MKRFKLSIIRVDDLSKEWLYYDFNQLLLDLTFDLRDWVDNARLISVRVMYD